MDVRLPDGTVIQGVPDGISKADLVAKLARNGYDVSKLAQAAVPNDVPQTDASGNYIPSPKPATPADPSLVDRIIGGGETALVLATGATGGTLGTIAGTAKGLVNSVRNGTFGTAAGADQVEQAAGDGAQALTYQPRTQTGQDYTQATGDAINSALPVMMMPELAGAAAGAKAGAGVLRETAENTAPTLKAAAKGIADRTGVTAAASAARDLVTAPKGTPEPPIVAQIRKVSPAIADRVQRTLERNPAPVDVPTNAADPAPIDTAQFDAARANVLPPDAAAPTPGTKGSVGAAGTDMATQREQVANQVGRRPDAGPGHARSITTALRAGDGQGRSRRRAA
jgi:hypothetical protein